VRDAIPAALVRRAAPRSTYGAGIPVGDRVRLRWVIPASIPELPPRRLSIWTLSDVQVAGSPATVACPAIR
jgi:hypothetical protein